MTRPQRTAEPHPITATLAIGARLIAAQAEERHALTTYSRQPSPANLLRLAQARRFVDQLTAQYLA